MFADTPTTVNHASVESLTSRKRFPTGSFDGQKRVAIVWSMTATRALSCMSRSMSARPLVMRAPRVSLQCAVTPVQVIVRSRPFSTGTPSITTPSPAPPPLIGIMFEMVAASTPGSASTRRTTSSTSCTRAVVLS